MLRIQNRIKHDNAELLTLIDRCSCIIIIIFRNNERR